MNSGSDSSNTPRPSVRASAARAARSLRNGAAHLAAEATDAAASVSDTVAEAWRETAPDLRNIAADSTQSALEWVRRHPIAAMASATALGWLAGRSSSRR